ncbi:JAB domain-containing protein [Ascidiimonas aurantiaca]|uniref:JAB domain-containing protein n=1 Tax=Ascidiimonas aurantiaca TaxID=1685432 RepID=UPI0030EBEA6E
MNVRLTEEQKIQIANQDDVYKIMQQVLLRQNKVRRKQEYFWALGLDKTNTILFLELIAIGRDNRVNVHPPDVFRMAIYKLAPKVILIHNHPSGILKPSQDDVDFTDRLLKVGRFIEIEVIEHLIITETGFTSFAAQGLIEQIKKSGLYELLKKEEKMIREFKLQKEKERGEKEKAIQIALKMQDEGFDIDMIKKMTGLTKTELKKILKDA